MKLRLTPAQMLDVWRLHVGYVPPITNAVFTRNDGIDTDSLHRAEINEWYRRLLLEAPAERLDAEDLSQSVVLPTDADASDGSTVIELPPSVVRILEVKLSSWRVPARIVTSPTHILAARQLHPFTRAGRNKPVALFFGGKLRLYPAARPSGDRIDSLSAVTCSADLYRFDDSALAALHPKED